MRKLTPFQRGFKDMMPILVGAIPFGAVMGTVSAEAGINLMQTFTMNLVVYAGASQLAAVDLMTKNAAVVVVVLSGMIINLRFLLYSAAMSPVLKGSSFWTKLLCAHTLTDQSYAVMAAAESTLPTRADKVAYYLGTATCMFIGWHSSVLAGFAFGNFAPEELALDYAVPLSFVALVIPTLKNLKYVAVAVFSFVVSIILHDLPLRLGLFVTALLSIALAAAFTRRSQR